MKGIVTLLCSLLLLSSCYKEQKSADTLKGTWSVNRIQWANGNDIAIDGDSHRIEFLPCEQAYTATCTGVYFLDYADTLRPDLIDTFRFEIKGDEFSVSQIKSSVPSNTIVTRILRQRYRIESLEDAAFTFKRIKTNVDSASGLITASKQ